MKDCRVFRNTRSRDSRNSVLFVFCKVNESLVYLDEKKDNERMTWTRLICSFGWLSSILYKHFSFFFFLVLSLLDSLILFLLFLLFFFLFFLFSFFCVRKQSTHFSSNQCQSKRGCKTCRNQIQQSRLSMLPCVHNNDG